jgi:AcrR family transcriptional regulator
MAIGKGRAGRGGRGGSAPDARRRLLESALALFTRKGYAAASVREIVEAAGVTRPVLYYYFGNKEGLFLELMGEPLARYESLLAETRDGGADARSRIRALCSRAWLLFRENVWHARLMYAIYYGPPQGAPFVDFDQVHASFRGAVEALLAEGIAAGEFRDGDRTAMLWSVVGAVNVAMEVELCHPDLSLGEKGLDAVLDVIFRGMERQRRPSPSVKGTKR